ncbi:MAG: hypothetical protein KI785_12220 [Devosiaceae bacterium]|nr:hypothetical protein [Devosiaceae bacterium MH13]
MFSDVNFKLAVISSLITSGTIDLGTPSAFLARVDKPDYDIEEDGYELSEAAYAYFRTMPLSAEQLGAVRSLSFDGGLPIYEYVFPFWTGETDQFDSASLADIQHVPNVERLSPAMLRDTDLTPLAGLQKLQVLRLQLSGSGWSNLDALLEVPMLQSLRVFGTNFKADGDLAVLGQLRAKGVKVTVL